MKSLARLTVAAIADTEKERQKCSYLPSPAEIEARCLEFQLEWSDSERDRRCGFRPVDVETMVVREGCE